MSDLRECLKFQPYLLNLVVYMYQGDIVGNIAKIIDLANSAKPKIFKECCDCQY